MKIVLNFLILGFVLNFTSAFLWFGSEDNEPTQPAVSTSTTQHSTIVVVQQQNHTSNAADPFRQAVLGLIKHNSTIGKRPESEVHNLTNVQRQNKTMKKNNTGNIPANRFHASIFRQQGFRSHQNPINDDINNRVLNPKFRALQRSKTIVGSSFNRPIHPSAVSSNSKANGSLNAKKNNQTIRSQNASVVNATNHRLNALPSQNIVNNKDQQDLHRLLANYYYHEQMRDNFGRLYRDAVQNNRGNILTALKRRRREDQPSDNPQSGVNSMIFSRNAPASDESNH